MPGMMVRGLDQRNLNRTLGNNNLHIDICGFVLSIDLMYSFHIPFIYPRRSRVVLKKFPSVSA